MKGWARNRQLTLWRRAEARVRFGLLNRRGAKVHPGAFHHLVSGGLDCSVS